VFNYELTTPEWIPIAFQPVDPEFQFPINDPKPELIRFSTSLPLGG